MRKLTLAAVAAFSLALSAGATMHATPAKAAGVSVQFDAGSVAFGLSDGYWDRDRNWHAWPNQSARNNWRARNKSHYTPHRHDRSPGWGWNDNKRWW